MSNRLSPEKAKAIAAEYITNGLDKVAAMITLGYKESYARSGKGLKIYDNALVKQEIARMQTQNELKADITRDEVVDDIRYGRKIAKERNNLMALRGFIELAARMGGMLTDNLNTADITKQRELEAEEKEEAKRIATIRLAQFAEESLKKGDKVLESVLGGSSKVIKDD